MEAAVDATAVQKVIMVSAAAVVQGDPEPLVDIDERVPVQQRSFAPSASKAAAGQVGSEPAGQAPDFS